MERVLVQQDWDLLLSLTMSNTVDVSIAKIYHVVRFCREQYDMHVISLFSLPMHMQHMYTHSYIACDPACNTTQPSLMRCFNRLDSGCCNFFENDMCVGSCTSPLVPNSNFDCGKLVHMFSLVLNQYAAQLVTLVR